MNNEAQRLVAKLLEEPELVAPWDDSNRQDLAKALGSGVVAKAIRCTYQMMLLEHRQFIGTLNALDPQLDTKYADKQGQLKGIISFIDNLVALTQREEKDNASQLAALS